MIIKTRNRIRTSLAGAALAGLAGLSACSAVPQITPVPSTSATTSTSTPTPSAPSPSASRTIALVDPNTASEAELAEALEQHGVPDARRWASAIKAQAPYTRDNVMDKLSNIVQSSDLNLLDMGKVNEVFRW